MRIKRNKGASGFIWKLIELIEKLGRPIIVGILSNVAVALILKLVGLK